MAIQILCHAPAVVEFRASGIELPSVEQGARAQERMHVSGATRPIALFCVRIRHISAGSGLILSTSGSRLRRAGGAAQQHLKMPRGAFMQLGGVRRERQSRRHPAAFERVA